MTIMDNDPNFDGPVELPGDEQRHSSPKFKPKRPFLETAKKPFLIIVALAAISGVGYGIWKLVPPKQDAPAAATNQQPQPAPAIAIADVPDAPNSETFKSSDLRIEFQHPKTWKVNEAEGGIRVVSPDFSYKVVAGGEKTGNFRIYIRKGAREVDGKYIGNGVAIKPSEKLVYSNPELGQREDTLLSSFGFDGSDNFSFFLLAGNFQLNKDDTLGPNYGREPETVIVAGGYSGKELTDDLATSPVPIDYLSTSKAYTQALEIVKSIKL